jgi:hypothetical protein
MTTPHVTEMPRRLEPVEHDPFIDSIPAQPLPDRHGDPAPDASRNARAPRTTERP